jgi:hypothetical protein
MVSKPSFCLFYRSRKIQRLFRSRFGITLISTSSKMPDPPCGVLSSSFRSSMRSHAPSEVSMSLFTCLTRRRWPPHATQFSRFQKNTARSRIGGYRPTNLCKVRATRILHMPSRAATSFCSKFDAATRRQCAATCYPSFVKFFCCHHAPPRSSHAPPYACKSF